VNGGVVANAKLLRSFGYSGKEGQPANGRIRVEGFTE